MKYYKSTPGKNVLWESIRFMIPEHVEAIRRQKEENKKLPPPLLDEQQLSEIGMVIMESLHQQQVIKIVYWQDGFYHEVNGIVSRIDKQLSQIKMLHDDDFTYIQIKWLKSVERL